MLLPLALVVPVAAIALVPRGQTGPDGPLRVVTGNPVRVVVSANPSAATIEARTRDALTDAASSARDPAMRSEWLRLRDDARALEILATRAEASLSSGRAAALAFPMFAVDASGDRLTIVAMTIEILPGRSGMATSRDHEDGHAEVNDQLALRCGPGIARTLTERGMRGAVLEAAIAERLRELADVAHAQYHDTVASARLGSHVRLATEASRNVAAAHCV